MTTSETPYTVTYGNWFLAKGKLVETFTEEEARRRFEGREQLDVIIGNPDSPDVVIDIGVDRMSVSVSFLDDLNRFVRQFHFDAPHKGNDWFPPNPGMKMFLRNAGIIEYLDDTPPPEDGKFNSIQMWFKQDGHVLIWVFQDGEKYEGEKTLAEPERSAILDETFPEFGHWDHLLNFERNLPA